MNLTTSFLALALLGMDDPKSTPDLPRKGSSGNESAADSPTDRETIAADRIRQRFLDLKQF